LKKVKPSPAKVGEGFVVSRSAWGAARIKSTQTVGMFRGYRHECGLEN